MRRASPAAAAALLLTTCLVAGCQENARTSYPPAGPIPESLAFQVTSIDGEPVDLARYLGKVVVVVNIASR
tara:strand:+ start:301 stop:513 length:213 start_codon:yes stop_codon:yes gene_type:complete